jgi:hypothetical protein
MRRQTSVKVSRRNAAICSGANAATFVWQQSQKVEGDLPLVRIIVMLCVSIVICVRRLFGSCIFLLEILLSAPCFAVMIGSFPTTRGRFSKRFSRTQTVLREGRLKILNFEAKFS